MVTVQLVPVLKDNYTYLAVDQPTRTCVIIDPPEVDPVIDKMRQEGLKPVAIWLTHHHSDHVAGVPGLLNQFPKLSVVCSERDSKRITQSTRSVKEGDRLELSLIHI